jgi:hypothetical protein
MSTEYNISGAVTLRSDPEVDELIRELRDDVLDFGDESVQIDRIDEATFELALVGGYSGSWHAGENIERVFSKLDPFAVGAGWFECESEGSRFVLYIGSKEETAKLASSIALDEIKENIKKLSDSDRAKLFGLIIWGEHDRRASKQLPAAGGAQ